MKRIIIMVTVLAIVFSAIYYLYSLKLGAIPFLILAIFFFLLAYRQLTLAKKMPKSEDKEK